MKRIFAVALVIVMVLGMCACSINKNEVSVLWSGANDNATDPNSLINAMDRALYIENISYKHYAASGDQAKQTQQAQSAVEAGCAALMVELVDSSAAQSIVDLAKAKNIPVVFFGCNVEEAVVSSYDKCALVTTDDSLLAEGYSAMVYSYFAANVKKQRNAAEKGKKKDGPDKDGDGNITYLALTDLSIATPNTEKGNPYGLKDKLFVDYQFIPVNGTWDDLTIKIVQKEKRFFFFFKQIIEEAQLVTADGKVVEAIFAEDDQQTLEMLVWLQQQGLNADKLTTHFIPVFTVGADADYKAYVMKDMPEGEASRKVYLESVMQLVDMTTIEKKEWKKWENSEENAVDSMIFNTLNQVSSGKLSGTTVEDFDAMAESAAAVVAKLIKGDQVDEAVVKIPYTFNISG